MALEVKAAADFAGSGIAFAHAVKAGPWIFLNGHEAVDFAAGIAPEVAGAAGFPLHRRPRWRREGDFILARMQRILEGFGSSLSQGVRLDQFYPTAAAVEPYHRARRDHFGAYIPPSTSVVMERVLAADCGISASLIARVADPACPVRQIQPSGVTSPIWSGYAPAVVCDEFVFVAGQMASGGERGLDPAAHVPDHARWGGSEVCKQAEFIIRERLAPALAAAGSSLGQALKAQVYLGNTNGFGDFLEVWDEHFREIPCALTVVPTKSFGTVGGIVEINLLALTDDARRKKEVVAADIPAMAAFGPCVKAGEFLLPSGLMPIGSDGAVVGREPAAVFDGLSHRGYTQAATVYDYAEALCRAAGTTLAHTLRAQYFIDDVAAFPGIARAWSNRLAATPHPFLCVQTPPEMPAPGMALIADFWISTLGD
jgi:enamine deaminase RidA (YjgF/YER057c/UK114 family)